MAAARNLLLVGNWQSDAGYAWNMIEQFWIALARAYPDRKVILTFPRVRGCNPELLAAGIEIVEFTVDFSRPRELVRFIRRHRIGHLYLTDRPYVSFVYPLLRLSGVRSITMHDHSPGTRPVPHGAKRVAKAIAMRLIHADAYIACSRYILDRARDSTLVPASRRHLAENGIVPNTYQRSEQTIRQELGLAADTLIVVSSSRAVRDKRIDNIIDAAAIVRTARPNTPLCFVHCGGGPDFEFFARRVRERGLDGYFRLLGKRNDLPRLLIGCDIAVHASESEVGLSLAILEFMSAALPAVVADEPSVYGLCIRDGETGLLFRSGSPEDLSAKLLRLIDDPALRHRIGAAGRQIANTDYNLHSTVAAVVTAVKTVVT